MVNFCRGNDLSFLKQEKQRGIKLVWKVNRFSCQHLFRNILKHTLNSKAYTQVLFSAEALLNEGASRLAGGMLSAVLLMT